MKNWVDVSGRGWRGWLRDIGIWPADVLESPVGFCFLPDALQSTEDLFSADLLSQSAEAVR